MVNQHSTVTELQQYISNSNLFTDVKVHKGSTEFVFEAYFEGEVSEENVRDELPMLFNTFNMSLSQRTAHTGTEYYRISCSHTTLIDNR